MDINSTNINKTNYHLSYFLTEHKIVSLHSNGHQFHQYQQNKPAPVILTHWTPKKKVKTVMVINSTNINKTNNHLSS